MLWPWSGLSAAQWPRELVPPGQGWDTVARGGWGWLALPLPVLYLFCG